jgi:S1-C subfamily serine protease
LIIDGRNVSASVKYLAPAADLAVLEAPGSGSHTGLPIEQSPEGEVENAFAFGFPRGILGATEDELVGRAKLRLRGHLSGTAPVLAWTETKRYPDDIDSLAGISGGPMIDDSGNVIGNIVAASVRCGLNYTVAPEILREIAHQLGAQFGMSPARDLVSRPVSLASAADTLRRASRIAETYCIPP